MKKGGSIFGITKNRLDQYFLKKIQPVGEFDLEIFYNFDKQWNLSCEEEE